MKQINTKFGILYIEEWEFDRHKPWQREEEDRVKIFDSNKNYLDHFSAEMVEEDAEHDNVTPQELLDQRASKLATFNTIKELLDWLGVDYEFVGTKEETIAYLHNELNWDLPSEDYNPLDNEWVNKIGDYYIVVSEY